MRPGPRLPELPAGFTVVEGDRGVMACRTEDAEALRTAGFGPDGTHRADGGSVLVDAEESGREPLGRLEVGGRTCLARRFTHGGLARAVTGRRFRDPSRPFDELVLSEALRERGVPTPRVVAARAVAVAPAGYELTLVTERLEGTLDLGHLLGQVRRGERPMGDLRRGLDAAGALVRKIHDAGCYHADLQPANLLVDHGCTGGAWVLDLDRSWLAPGGELGEAARLKNLARLWRHVARREREYGPVLGRRGALRFLRAYGVPARELGDRAREIAAAAGRGGAFHGLGWWLERRFGRGVDERAAGGDR